MAKTIIGVMGPGEHADQTDLETAETLGRLVAEQGWVLLTGGRNAGVMHAASSGAREAGGITVGILPSSDRRDMSPSIEIPILTGMGSARNNVNALSSDVLIACGTGMGTMSEVLLASKAGKSVILINYTMAVKTLLEELEIASVHFCSSPDQAIRMAKKLI